MSRSRSRSSFFTSHWPGTLFAWVALLVAGALMLLYLQAALDWQSQPFAGFLPVRNLEISRLESVAGDDWPARDAGLMTGDRVVSLDGVDLQMLPPDDQTEALLDALADHRAGETVDLVFTRDATVSRETPAAADCTFVQGTIGLRRCTVAVELVDLSAGDLFSYFGLGWVAALALWISAAALLLRSPRSIHARYSALLAAALVIFLAGRFDTVSTHRYAWAWLVGTCLASGVMMVIALEYPYRFALIQHSPPLLWAPIIAALALSGLSVALYRSTDTNLSQSASALAIGVLLIGMILLLSALAWRRSRSASPIARNQATLVIIGLVPVLIPALIWFASMVLADFEPAALIVLNQILPLLLPFSLMYAVVQVRMVDTDTIISQGTLYATLVGLMLFSYWLIVAGLAVYIERSTAETALDPVVIVVAILVVAVVFTPLRLFLQRRIDAVYFRTRSNYRAMLENFSRQITQAEDLDSVTRFVLQTLGETLLPQHILLFVRDIVTYEYRAQPDPKTGVPVSDAVFTPDSGLIRFLRDRSKLLYLKEGSPLPQDVVGERARLALLGAPVIVGLRGQKALNGFLVIGPRTGGAPYEHEDLRFIENLSDQAALAVERAQAMDDLERRVRVQDVLSQVSRALNFAIDFDVLLELIYAQTTRVINAPCFFIALRDPNVAELEYVFYNVGDERIDHMEGQRWRIGADLMSEIVRTQQTLRTEDYVRETLSRDPRLVPDNPELKAWMGVPLLADTGSGVLGVMVAATTEPGTTFNDEQLDLFWDIANLASSAIDKLQLFEKTQQRARQLSVINSIANQMAAEIGSVDRLLRMITENAVEILGAEAGSLLLVDEETQDLEFHVVTGGKEELVGTRLPAGSGLAGATVQRADSIIVNDPTRDTRWYGELFRSGGQEAPDDAGDGALDAALDNPLLHHSGNGSGGGPGGTDGTDGAGGADGSAPGEIIESGETGFRSDAILSVPLMVGGRPIGVLQVLNKRDGSIFIKEDADLLETFAGQAAIAIENARLFDMTDQQLALRVQELDTMQRIDQELNRTLNLRNVVDITMDWALRKSGARAGALFILDRDNNELRIVASYGYPPDGPVDMSPDQVYPADRGVVGRVVRSAQPSLITDVAIDPDYDETLPGCVAQLVVPLFSANQVIGVIILESSEDGQLDLLDLDFVARLAEHASPAITNAQLFQELERANQDKSAFVSMIAHELKNPMTSMKGYTDLLIKGVVGPVNEQQSGFLSTIFNNVARMETLVSDLNDLTKQQTGNMRLELAPLDFRNVVMETLRAQQRQIEDKDQDLDIQIPDNLPTVMGDQNRLIQIMTNFVSNAYKYTPQGGTITIMAEHTRNHWDPQGAAHVIHCFVRDTGIGMSQDDLKHLFTPYFRSDNPKTREQPGTGLGLSITRGLIEQHGGRVWVESEIDVGTTFHFTLPVASEQETTGQRV